MDSFWALGWPVAIDMFADIIKFSQTWGGTVILEAVQKACEGKFLLA